jgi:hypothetical protein
MLKHDMATLEPLLAVLVNTSTVIMLIPAIPILNAVFIRYSFEAKRTFHSGWHLSHFLFR